jgi:DegV family protein with EDD domain
MKGVLSKGTSMGKVVVVTDSSANVPAHLVQQLDIRVVPILLALNGRTFRDGVDVTAQQVYQWLRTSKHLPTTSAPSIGDFLRVYATAAQEASDIVSIHLSPKLSATYKVARAASQLVDDATIRVINSQTVAMGQGFVAVAAARAAAGGADLEEVVARAEQVSSKMNVLATLDTLEYLHRGGRIGGGAAVLGTLLQIKPVLFVTDGHVDLFARPRTKSKAIRIMMEQLTNAAGGGSLHVAVFHADVPKEAEALRNRIATDLECDELYVTEMTPIMGAHTGPGVLGVVFYAE